MNGPDAGKGIQVPVDIDCGQRVRVHTAGSPGEGQGQGHTDGGQLSWQHQDLATGAGGGGPGATEPGQAGSRSGTESQMLGGILRRTWGPAGYA